MRSSLPVFLEVERKGQRIKVLVYVQESGDSILLEKFYTVPAREVLILEVGDVVWAGDTKVLEVRQ